MDGKGWPGQRVLLGDRVLGRSQGRAVEAMDIQSLDCILRVPGTPKGEGTASV